MSNLVDDIFDELDNINLNSLFRDPEDEKKGEKSTGEITITPEECLYDKTYECPCCDSTFKARTVRKNKAKFITTDLDLKSNYEPIQPDYYDVISCDECGYTAITTKFNILTNHQVDLIQEKITVKFRPKSYPEIYTPEIALERYKLALLCCITKNAKSGEKAFICLKIAWIYRDLKDKKNEISYLKASYEGFMDAFAKEKFPLCGLDENTLLYILAAIAYEIGEKTASKRTLGNLLIKRNLPQRLKDKADDLREILRKE